MRFAIATSILLVQQLLPTATEEEVLPNNPQKSFAELLHEFSNSDSTKTKIEWKDARHGISDVSGKVYDTRVDRTESGNDRSLDGRDHHHPATSTIMMNRNGRLMNNRKFPNSDHGFSTTKDRLAMNKPCDPTSNTNNIKNNMMASDHHESQQQKQAADVGILECGDHQYCMESIYSVLGGFCTSNEEEAAAAAERLLQRLYHCDPRTDHAGWYCIYYNYCLEDTCDVICYDKYVSVYYEQVVGTGYEASYVNCRKFYRPGDSAICVTRRNDVDCEMTFDGQDCAFCRRSPDGHCTYFDCSNVQSMYGPGVVGHSCAEVPGIQPFAFYPLCEICPSCYTRDPCRTACPYGVSVTNPNATTGLGLKFLKEGEEEALTCGEAQEHTPLLAFYHDYIGEEGCTRFQEMIESRCGCGPTVVVPVPTPQPSTVPSSVPTTTACSERGSDITCIFNENEEERRTAVCLREVDEATGFYRFRNACWKNSELEGLVPGDPINIMIGTDDEEKTTILYDCGCCDRCDIYGMTHLPIRNLNTKHCRRPAICTPDDDDDDWEVCFAWGNGIVKTIKVCIIHQDGTQEETCVDPFFIPSHASDMVTCGRCRN